MFFMNLKLSSKLLKKPPPPQRLKDIIKLKISYFSPFFSGTPLPAWILIVMVIR
jgi:hypothetical protein